MRLLLDSHVLLWWLDDHRSLGSAARETIVDADEVAVSAATVWELGIKAALGKLEMPGSLTDAIADNGFVGLAITVEHGERAAVLPAHHRDPFDRTLIAQARSEALTLVTADRQFDAYEVARLDATA